MQNNLKFFSMNLLGLLSSKTCAALLPILVSVFLATGFSTTLTAQCSCTPVYTVGTGAPVPIPTLSAAIGNFPGIQNPGAVCVKIIGQFDVDAGQTWDLGTPAPGVSTQVIFENSTSSLFVQNNGVLNAHRTTFQPCSLPGSWLGVYLQSGSVANITKSNFRFATHGGIGAAANSTFHITGSFFERCDKGIFITGVQSPSNHTISGNQFYNCKFSIYMTSALNVNVQSNEYVKNLLPPAIEPDIFMTGIYLSPLCRDISISNGIFRFIDLCISTLRATDVYITSPTFLNSKAGISSMEGSGDLTISTCNFSTTEGIGIQINYHNTNNGAVLIDGNTFTQKGPLNNMLLKDIGGSGNCTVKNNLLDLPAAGAAPAPVVRYGIEVQKFYATGGLAITNNDLLNDNPGLALPGGIYVQNSTMPVAINDNSVLNAGSNGSMPVHIRTVDCRTTLDIIGNNVDGGTPISARGISIENCPATLLLCCNTLNQSNTGLYITGPMNSAQIYNTVFGLHPYTALHYNQVTSTGAPQVNHGNDWSGAAGTWDARLDGGPAGLLNYVVSNSNLPNGLTKIFPNTGWFTTNNAAEPVCGSVCGQNQGGMKEDGEERNNTQTINQLQDISVYPNPANEVLFVDIATAMAEPSEIFLRDGLGRIIKHETVPAGSATINLPTAECVQGIYILELMNNNHITARSKVLILHR